MLDQSGEQSHASASSVTPMCLTVKACMHGTGGPARILARGPQRHDREHEQGHQARAAGQADAQGSRISRL